MSSGLDSSVNLAWAVQEMDLSLALTFDYGQLSASKEIEFSQKLCKQYKVSHQIVDLKWFSSFSKSSLNSGADLPLAGDVSIDDLEISIKTAKSVWVPNRNGIFLNIAAGFAEGFGADFVIAGFNKEEAATFPDNSLDFLKATDLALQYSTANRLKTHSYTISMDKTEIVKKGLELNLDFSKVWPCYQNFKQWCGECESCQRYRRALKANGIDFERIQ